jgi:hypothetical protein
MGVAVPLAHEAYLVSARRSDTLAALRRSASNLAWDVVEESGTGFFMVERRRTRWRVFSEASARLAVTVEDSEDQTLVRFVEWGRGFREASELISSMLADSGLASMSTQVGLVSSRLIDGPRSDPQWLPSWVRWARFGEIAPMILLVPLVGVLIWAGAARGWPPIWLLLLALWVLFSFLGWLIPALVIDIVPRRVTGVRSRSGVWMATLSWGLWGALSTGVILGMGALLDAVT